MSAVNIVRRLLDLDPTLTYRQLGEYAGISRQRAHQIVQAHGLPKSRQWTESSRLCSGGCGTRLRFASNHSGWCRMCNTLAHGYEYRCGECGEWRVATGRAATSRRSNTRKKKKYSLDFCGNVCSGKFYARRRRENGTWSQMIGGDK
jgi:hypothetical protein